MISSVLSKLMAITELFRNQDEQKKGGQGAKRKGIVYTPRVKQMALDTVVVPDAFGDRVERLARF
jgi:stalled ribosome alternative rescue factor ArfA